MLYTITVFAHAGRALVHRIESNGSLRNPSTYCCVSLDDQEIRTATKSRTDAPRWSESIVIKCLDGYDHTPLTVSVWDKDKSKRTLKLIGSVRFNMQHVSNLTHEETRWYDLQHTSKMKNSPSVPHRLGQVQLELRVERTSVVQLIQRLQVTTIHSEEQNEILRHLSKLCSNKCMTSKDNRTRLNEAEGVSTLLHLLENRKTETRASYAIKNALLNEEFIENFIRLEGLQKLGRCLNSKSALLVKNVIQSVCNAVLTSPATMAPLLKREGKLFSLVSDLLSPNERGRLDSFHLKKTSDQVNEKVFVQITRLISLLTHSSDESQRDMGDIGAVSWLLHLMKMEQENEMLVCSAIDTCIGLIDNSGENQVKLIEANRDNLLVALADASTSVRVKEALMKLIAAVVDKRGRDVATEYFLAEMQKPHRLQVLTNLCDSKEIELRRAALQALSKLSKLGLIIPLAVHSGHYLVTPLSHHLTDEDEEVLSGITKVILHCCLSDVPIMLCEGELAQRFMPHRPRSGSKANVSLSEIRARSLSNLSDSNLYSQVYVDAVINWRDPRTKKTIQRGLGVLPLSPFIRLIHSHYHKVARRCLRILSILVRREASVDGAVEPASTLFIHRNFVEMMLSKLHSKDKRTLVYSTNILADLAHNEASIPIFGSFSKICPVTDCLFLIRENPEEREIFHNACFILSTLCHNNVFLREGGVGIISKVMNMVPLPRKIALTNRPAERREKLKELIGMDEALTLLDMVQLKKGIEGSGILRENGIFRAVTNILIHRPEALPATQTRAEKIFSILCEGLPPRERIVYEIFSTEYFYVKFLRLAKKIFVDPLSRSGLLKDYEMEKIFSPVDLAVFIDFHTLLLIDWQHRLEEWSDEQLFCDIFLASSPFFTMYKEYCVNFERLPVAMKELKSKNEGFKRFIQKQQTDHKIELTSLDLESILIMPVQRPPRYTLLFKELLKKTPEDHPDYANLRSSLKESEEIARNIDSNIQTSKQEEMLYELADRLKMNIYLPHRVFVKEGILLQFLRKGVKGHKLRYFLFNDAILLTRRIKTRKLTETEIHFTLVDKFTMDELEISEKISAPDVPAHYKPGLIRSKYSKHYYIVASPSTSPNEKESLFTLLEELLPSRKRSSTTDSDERVDERNLRHSVNDWFDEISKANESIQSVDEGSDLIDLDLSRGFLAAKGKSGRAAVQRAQQKQAEVEQQNAGETGPLYPFQLYGGSWTSPEQLFLLSLITFGLFLIPSFRELPQAPLWKLFPIGSLAGYVYLKRHLVESWQDKATVFSAVFALHCFGDSLLAQGDVTGAEGGYALLKLTAGSSVLFGLGWLLHAVLILSEVHEGDRQWSRLTFGQKLLLGITFAWNTSIAAIMISSIDLSHPQGSWALLLAPYSLTSVIFMGASLLVDNHLMIAGTILYIASDSMILLESLIDGHLWLFTWPTYYVAQWLLFVGGLRNLQRTNVSLLNKNASAQNVLGLFGLDMEKLDPNGQVQIREEEEEGGETPGDLASEKYFKMDSDSE
ncbi:hypothetical protein PROFUN_09499 [Planoprotostelium fungivorum]|uniref:C2 domain-containing protein n=1 Tax=Planoprotostelium fungivorum TaxID=1890364 RepID=A0A2P6NH66_9EUKA|nr:hypothetical protein PROFUN_09499 [Planoprotostelium fungivorum]